MRIRSAGFARVVVSAVAIVAIAGCSSSHNSGSTDRDETTSSSAAVNPSTTPLPEFYSSAKATGRGPGTLLNSQRIAAPDIHGTVYRVLYQSLSTTNTPVVVSGIIVVPKRPPPSTGYPVVTWGHGTTGLGDGCAPSLAAATPSPPSANTMLDKGWELANSDYVGLGTPGVMPYLAGASAARNVIDIVRAARQLPAAHASKTYAVWGYSEGGQTAMFVLKVAPTYAPELHLTGVVAGAPPSHLRTLYSFLAKGRYRFYVLMLIVGMHAAYGDALAPLDQVLSPTGMDLVHEIENDCVSIAKFGLGQPSKTLLPAKLADVTIASAVKADPFTVPTWRRVLMANDPENFTSRNAAPLLIVQGGADDQIPPPTTASLMRHECSIGQDVEQWTYPTGDHPFTLAISAADVVKWLGDRFAGDPAPDPYVPTGQKGVVRTTCPS